MQQRPEEVTADDCRCSVKSVKFVTRYSVTRVLDLAKNFYFYGLFFFY